MHALISDNRDAINLLCRRHGVRKMEVFGSLVRDDFDAGVSDVDVLVEFASGADNTFANFLDLKDALETLFGCPVDLMEPHTIRNRRLRYHIHHSSEPVYGAA